MTDRDIPVSSIREPLEVHGKYFRAGGETCFLKAVTFGPFPAGAFPDEGRAQLERIAREAGANAIRLYEIPSLEFLHECARVGLRVFLTLPWAHHIDFLSERQALAEADQLLLETIARFRGHPAVAGYFVGNEIESTLVRWMGRRKVVDQIERLIELGRANDPDVLFSYANYPSTEYLIPRNQDFLAFNIYLERREELESYLFRLQNLAGNKPVMVSEFGVDSRTHGELSQAEILEWHIDAACRAGLTGTTIFSWSDLWRRGGRTIEEFDFGLTRRDGSTRPAMDVVREKWATVQRPSELVESPKAPKVSVIICTYRGSATLVPCLDSVTDLEYPDYEVLVVNDGDDDRVSEIAATYESVRHIGIEHQGLSAARNIGAKESEGEILVYTDDDCIVEKDWLHWIALQFDGKPETGCAGGPNVPPEPETRVQSCIIPAPGGPSHVLLTDTTAEHLPGCNLAVRKSVFEEVGGFNPIFRSAGDDVDFCWRVMDAGHQLSFHPAAFVWHYRRFTIRAYLRQQFGYGKAEGLLLPLHTQRFRGLGGAVWKGQVYTPRHITRGFVYHGQHGYEPFQLIYPDPDSGLGEVALHILWWVLFLGAVVAAGFWKWMGLIAALMVFTSIRIAWKRAAKAEVDPDYDSVPTRLAIAGLVIAQGFVRSGARLRYGWKYAKWSRGLEVLTSATMRRVVSGWWKLGDEKAFWSEDGIGRDELLAEILANDAKAQTDESGRTDLILKRGLLWNWALVTATEYHEDQKRLTRARLLARPRLLTRLIVLPFLILAPWLVLLEGGKGIDLITPLVIYLGVSIAARIFMKLRRPELLRYAERVGLEPVT